MLQPDQKVHIPRGFASTIKTPCSDGCPAYAVIRATGKGIGIDQHPCTDWECKPAATLRYYLHGDDSVSVELRDETKA